MLDRDDIRVQGFVYGVGLVSIVPMPRSLKPVVDWNDPEGLQRESLRARWSTIGLNVFGVTVLVLLGLSALVLALLDTVGFVFVPLVLTQAPLAARIWLGRHPDEVSKTTSSED